MYPLEVGIFLREVLSKLPRHHSAVLWAYYLGAMDIEEIARMSGLTTAAVRKRIQRALRAARTLIAK
jgi:DNA-directed RNA polymerase specialized sigma24 family protein